MQLSKFRALALGAVLSLSVSVACAGPQASTDMADVVAAHATWKAAKMSKYSFVLTQYCFCPQRHLLRVHVRDGVVQSADDATTGQALSASELRQLPTLDALFDLVLAAYKRNAAVIQVHPHPQYGFLDKVFIDYDLRMADEEAIYQVTDFLP